MFYDIYTKEPDKKILERNVPKHLVHDIIFGDLARSGKNPESADLWYEVEDEYGNTYKVREF